MMSRRTSSYDLTAGPVVRTLLVFAVPMILGNLLQQVYNITDTLIVGKVLGSEALAAVGSAYTLMTFLTSLIIGLCMGCGALFSFDYGAKDQGKLEKDVFSGFLFVSGLTLILFLLVWFLKDRILIWLQSPAEVRPAMGQYLTIIYTGLIFTFLYNFCTYLLRAMGNSKVPLYFLGTASILNVVLDLFFVIGLRWGIRGAAGATVIAQGVSGIGLLIYTLRTVTWIRIRKENRGFHLKELKSYCLFTSLQQSVMNFGILMIQGLVNTFGTTIMAAFAAAVKIDTLAYMPAQEFGNAYSLFISQNHGARQQKRITEGTKKAFPLVILACLAISGIIYLGAPWLMQLFTNEEAIIAAGVRYLRIEGACYFGIGCLFLWYGYFRGIGKPAYSLVLTIVSLGTRVLLAYLFAPRFGVQWIWWAIVIGWILADVAGMIGKRVIKA